MFKKTIAVVLSVLIMAYFSCVASAAENTTPPTLKDKVNAMKLEPLRPSYWDKAFIKRVEASVKGKKTNYDKLVAVYDYIRTNETDKKLMSSAFEYTYQLQCAFEIVGFRTYCIAGEWTAKDGWDTTWVGIDIGNSLYYFDAGLPALQGVNTKQCFGVAYKSSKLYKNASIWQMEMSPVTTKGGDMNWALADANGIPNSVSKRKPYRSVPDKCHPPSLYYAANNGYWKMTDDTITPILDTDKEGNKFIFYPDGTRKEFTGTIKKAS